MDQITKEFIGQLDQQEAYWRSLKGKPDDPGWLKASKIHLTIAEARFIVNELLFLDQLRKMRYKRTKN